MKRRALLAISGVVFAWTAMALEPNDHELIPLDAEALAEAGIAHAYKELGPILRKYIPEVANIQEKVDNDSPSYSVSCLGRNYFIYGGDDQEDSWGRATFAFFDIVNRQLEGTKYRFFAINAGNDLMGMFLTLEQAEKTKKSLPRRENWPYLPVLKRPWYGQFH